MTYVENIDNSGLGDIVSIAIVDGDIDIVKKIVEIGNFENIEYDNMAEEAAYNGEYEIVEFLIEKGAKNFEDIAASGCCYEDIVLLAIRNGARNYNEIVIRAAEKGCISVVESMLELGVTNYDDIIRVARKHGYLDIVKLLIDD